MNNVATVVRRALKIDSLSANTPALKRAANDGPTTHQLHIAYLPVIPVKANASATSDLLERWLQDRFAAMRAARPMPDFRDSAGALSKADRFALGHAASTLKDLQAVDIAGRAVINLSSSCMTDPMLPVYVISLFQRRGVSLVGVNVTLGTARQRRLPGGALHNAALESPTYVRYRTDNSTGKQSSWGDALLGRRGMS